MDKYMVSEAHLIPTPALLVFRECVEENIRRMGELLGGYSWLRSSVSYHVLLKNRSGLLLPVPKGLGGAGPQRDKT